MSMQGQIRGSGGGLTPEVQKEGKLYRYSLSYRFRTLVWGRGGDSYSTVLENTE